jgi:hypothetical protein
MSAATKKDCHILANYETSCTLKRLSKWLKFWTHTQDGLTYISHGTSCTVYISRTILRLGSSRWRAVDPISCLETESKERRSNFGNRSFHGKGQSKPPNFTIDKQLLDKEPELLYLFLAVFTKECKNTSFRS